MEVSPGIHLVDGVRSNVYLIADPAGFAVVDTGMPGSARRILRYLKRLGARPQALRYILLTHQHPDHVGGARALAEATGAQVGAHPLDAPAIAGQAPRDLPRAAPLRAVFRAVILPRVRPVPSLLPVEDGEPLPILEREGGLRVLATPGHTAGHVAYYLPARSLLFAGDAYAHRGGRIVATPAVFSRDPARARRSLIELARFDVDISLPGHGRPIVGGAGARLAELAAKLKRR